MLQSNSKKKPSKTAGFRKLAGKIHLWLGLASGLVVFIIGITGSIYVFSDDLKPIVYKDRLYIEPQNTTRLPLSQLLEIARKNLGNEHKISRAELSMKADRPYVFRALKLNPKGLTYNSYYTYYYKIYINPYNGKLVFKENTKYEFFQLVLSLHMTLLLGNKIGHYIVSYAVLTFVLMLITGMILWWPKKWSKRNCENSFKVKWTAKFKRLNYDLHNVFGFYAFFLLLVISLTGLVWCFNWFDQTVQFVARGGKTVKKEKSLLSDTTKVIGEPPIDLIFKQAQSKSPGALKYLFNFPAKASATINISAYLSDDNLYQRRQSKYDQSNGKLLQSNAFDELDNGAKIKALNYDLHTGSVLGFPGKILALFASLTAASLPITGFLIWLGKKRKKGKA